MLRSFLPFAIAIAAVAVACGGGDGSSSRTPVPGNGSTIVPVPTVAKPFGVPEDASAVQTTTALGTIERQANAEPDTEDTRTLEGASCADDVAVFRTDRETVYAAFPPIGVAPCDRFWDTTTRDLFVGEEMAIVLEVTSERQRVLFETVEGAQSEFSFAGIWVE